MKKIMFNDRYDLTKAVLGGWKTMTRRIIKAPKTMEGQWVSGFAICKRPGSDEVVEVMALDADEGMINNILPKYKPGEVVAVAQKYKDVYWHNDFDLGDWSNGFIMESPGWNNKMFVCAEMMPHQIRITSVRVERLQDISDEDCYKEGIMQSFDAYYYKGFTQHFNSAREAFAALIDKVSGKGTWASNPWVFVYEFELIK